LGSLVPGINVVLQIPTGIFIDDHEEGDEFAVNVGGAAARARSAFSADEDSPTGPLSTSFGSSAWE
jgi:hypothetical protein